MAVSMGRTARALVWASLPAELSEPDRREQFFLRFYGADFSPERRAEIGSHVRRTAAAPQRVFGVAEPTRSGGRHLP